jgi:hypothetical protein
MTSATNVMVQFLWTKGKNLRTIQQSKEKLKKGILYISIIIIISLLQFEMAFGQVPIGVKDALNSGNSQQLSKFFNKNIDLLIDEKEDVYSKAQAELILKDFFTKHHPDTFKVENEGFSEGMNYTIGKLITSNGKFRIYLTYYIKSGKQCINRINISGFK